jgi:hypothetical protein
MSANPTASGNAQTKFQLNVSHLNPMEALEQEREEEKEIKLHVRESRPSELNMFFSSMRLSPK